MRKLKSLFLVVVLLIAAIPVSAQMECVPGYAFRDQYGNLLDCLEEGGSNCLSCRMIIIVS